MTERLNIFREFQFYGNISELGSISSLGGVASVRWVLSVLVFLCSLACSGFLTGCSLLKEKDPADPDLMEAAKEPIPPEKAEKIVDSAAGNWFYGQGVGDTAITAGTVIAFPPYLVVVLGNAALSLSGYEPITVSGLLPEEAGKEWSDTYDAVASSPGRLSAAVAGKEFRTPEVIKDDMKRLLKENPHDGSPADSTSSSTRPRGTGNL